MTECWGARVCTFSSSVKASIMQKPMCGHNERVTFQVEGESVGEGPQWWEGVDITGRSARQLSERAKDVGRASGGAQREEGNGTTCNCRNAPRTRPPNKNE